MKRTLNILIAVGFIAIASQAQAQLTVAWTGSNGNIVANNAAGGVSIGKYEGGDMTLQGGSQASIDGMFLSVQEAPELQTFSVYPNPATDVVFVEAEPNTQVSVYNLQGELIVTTTAGQVDVRNLSPGSYLIAAQGYKTAMIIKY